MLARLAELETMERHYRQTLENLYLYQEELRAQNDELRHAQISLENARRRHQELFDFSPVAQFLVSPNGMILKTNRVAASLLGLGGNDLFNYHMPNLAGDSRHRVALLNFLTEVAANKHPAPIGVDLFRRDGGSVLVQLHGSRSSAQQETSILLTAVDNNHCAELEQERLQRKRAESMFSAVLAVCGQPMFAVDTNWRFCSTNPPFQDLTGYGGGELTKLELFDLWQAAGPTDWDGWAALQNALDWQGEATIRHRSGRSLPVKLTMTAVCGEQGFTIAYLGQLTAEKC